MLSEACVFRNLFLAEGKVRMAKKCIFSKMGLPHFHTVFCHICGTLKTKKMGPRPFFSWLRANNRRL